MGNGRLSKSSHEYPSLREEAALQIDKSHENLVPDRDGTLRMLPYLEVNAKIAMTLGRISVEPCTGKVAIVQKRTLKPSQANIRRSVKLVDALRYSNSHLAVKES
jgi:hypothetical protein